LRHEAIGLRIFPPKIEVADDEGFVAAKDIFNRSAFGTGLANLVSAVEEPMVIALDGQWGSGKTTFIKMWAGLLRQRGHPVIYFDSFANDYIDDAFLAIAGEVVSLSQRSKSASTPAHIKFLKGAARAGRAILRSGAKIGVKAATLGALDAADLEELKSITGDIADELGAKSDEYIKSLLSRHGNEQKSIEGFRKALSELAATLSAKLQSPDKSDSDNVPLIFIVDELDRCKPPFALDLLEKIKHIFSVPGVHFVLVTHLTQLENFVRLSYGNEIDARTYLQKFYNLIVHLPGDGKYEHERISRKYIAYLRQHLTLDNEALGFIDSVVHARQLSLRSLEKILTYMSLAIAFTTSKTLTYFRPSPILAGLCVLKAIEPQLFQKAKSGSLTLDEASDAFQFSRWPMNNAQQWAVKSWQYALDPNLDLSDPEWQRWGSGGSPGFSIDRQDIVRVVADGVIDRMEIPAG
jgi:energy-coupling factor transporter ATP-binding protein EcfA2